MKNYHVKNIKWLSIAILFLLSVSTKLEASFVEVPLTWGINSSTQFLENDEPLGPDSEGYLDFVWDGSLVYFGFYNSQTLQGTTGLSGGIYMSSNGNGGFIYVRHMNTWHFKGYIANPGDCFRLSRLGDQFVVHHNGTELHSGVIPTTQTLYPYIYDNSGLHKDRLEYYKKPTVYIPEVLHSTTYYRIFSNVLRRGQDGFVEYEYNGEPDVYVSLNRSKDINLVTSVVRVYYSASFQWLYIYYKGNLNSLLSVNIALGEKIRIAREGSSFIISTGNVEKKFFIDGNLDLHPTIYKASGAPQTQLYVSFDTKGGVCQDYYSSLPSYINANPDTYYPPSLINENWNLVHSKTYDGEGEGPCHVINESRSYSDEMGRGIQSQAKDYLRNKVWTSQTLYDYLGRPALSTMAAPTGLNIIQYQQDFVKNAQGNAYSPDDYDRTYNANGTININKTNSPNPVGSQSNTLGHWYSQNNSEEPWQATTQYPYSRTEYSELTGAARRSTGPGNAYKMGDGHEIESHTMRTGNELRFVIGQKKPLCLLAGTAYDDAGFLSTTCSGAGTVYNSKYSKTIAVDADGKQAVVFHDENGNEIAKALSGKVKGANVQTQSTTIGIPIGQYRDFHITDADNTVSVWNSSGQPTSYDVYDLSTDQKIISNGSASPMTLSPGFYRFVPLLGYLTINYTLNYYNFSLNIYDKRNQLIATVAPNDVVYNATVSQHNAYSFYRYNSFGQLIWSETPDAGRTHYFYRKDGQLRFSQNAQQAIDANYSYVKYDPQGRPIETGECQVASPFGVLQSSVDIDDFPVSNNQERIWTTYDIADPSLPANRQQEFVDGGIAKISNDDGTIWYSYNEEGQVDWIGQSISGLSGIKFTDYKYDLLGNVTEVTYEEGQAEEFRHHYAYDDNSQLRSVGTRSDNSIHTAPKLQVQYEYKSTGEQKKMILADGLEKQDFVYTLNGTLKAINPKDMASADINSHKRTFSMALDYYPDDYIAANGHQAGVVDGFYNGSAPHADENYTGKIAVQRWKARAEVGGTDFSGHFAYGYKYNHRNEFVAAKFGRINPTSNAAYDGTFSAVNDYTVLLFGSEYDANGNIEALLRYGPNQILIDYFFYSYDKSGGKNRLTRIQDFAGNGTYGDLTTQSSNNYSYDALGQMTDDVSEDNNLMYNSAGKVIEVRERMTNDLKASYVYGPDGQRVKKLSYNANGILNKTSWYVKNAEVFSLYEQNSGGNIEPTEMAINGGGRIGTAYYASGNYTYQYELKDHLGNVRAVIGDDGSGETEALYYADYYPYGWTLPGRNGGSSRYDYQGEFAEKDEETGWNAFELRMYDGRMARWTSIDPEEEFWSPYVAMGNDPVNLSDPTGGMTDPSNGGVGLQYSDDLFYRVSAMAGAGREVGPPGFFSSLGTIGGTLGNGVLYALGFRESPGINSDAFFSAVKSTAYTMNEFNPITNGVSGIRGFSQGLDIYGHEIGRWESGFKLGSAVLSFAGIRMYINGGNLNFGKTAQLSIMSRVTAPGMSGFRVVGFKYKKFQGAIDYHNWIMRKGGRSPITEKFWHFHWGRGKTGKHHMQFGTGIKLQQLSELRRSWFGLY